jgi:DNA modification methylase
MQNNTYTNGEFSTIIEKEYQSTPFEKSGFYGANFSGSVIPDTQRQPENEIDLIHGDSLQVMTTLEPETIDLILSDPPYGVFLRSDEHPKDFDKPIDWQRFEDIVWPLLKPDGQVLLFCDFNLLLKLRTEFSRLRYDFHHCIIKSSGMPKGEMFPIPDVEYLAVFRKGKISAATFHPKAAMRSGEAYRKKNYSREISTRRMTKSEITNGDQSRWITQSLFMKSKPNLSRQEIEAGGGHPFQKELNLLQEIVRVYSNQGDLILDPFTGSGSTLIASHRENRRSFGIEQDRKWYEVAAERIEQATAQMRIF